MASVSPQKRKHVVGDDGTPARKVKKEVDKSTPKGKSNRQMQSEDGDTAFRVTRSSLTVSIPPVFAANLHAGVEEMLDSMLMRYIPALQGVVLAHSNIKPLDRTALIKGDCPFIICDVAFNATLWSPQVGMRLAGKISLCSPDHVSLLVHRTFNASIPRHHIPQDRWEFEYGPAENDPEYAPENEEEEEEEEEGRVHGGGRWVDKTTRGPLGGEGGLLEFTVIGLTVANEMVSLKGSIQDDPFSPEHIPPSQIRKLEEEEQEEEASVTRLAWGDHEMEPGTDDDDDLGSVGQFYDLEEANEVSEKKVKRKKKKAEGAEVVKKKKKKRDRPKSNDDDTHKKAKRIKS